MELLLRGRGQTLEFGHAKQTLDDRALAAVVANVHALTHRLEFSAFYGGHATEGSVVFGHDDKHVLPKVMFDHPGPCGGSEWVIFGQALGGS